MKTQSPDFLKIYREFHAYMDKPGYRPLIQCASLLFDAPVVFTNNKYELISLYPAKKINDFVYDTLLETGGLPEETIAAFHKEYLWQPGRRYEPFFEEEGLVKDCPRIFAEVYDDVKIWGHVAIFLNDKEFQPWHLEAAAILTDVLRIKLNLSSQLPSAHADMLQYLLGRNAENSRRPEPSANL